MGVPSKMWNCGRLDKVCVEEGGLFEFLSFDRGTTTLAMFWAFRTVSAAVGSVRFFRYLSKGLNINDVIKDWQLLFHEYTKGWLQPPNQGVATTSQTFSSQTVIILLQLVLTVCTKEMEHGLKSHYFD